MDSSLVVMILLGLVIIFSLVVAYFSARTAHIAHVLLVASLFLVGVVFLILGSATLQTHATWRNRYNQLEQALEAELKKTEGMLHGDSVRAESDPQSIPELRGALERATLDRGRVWRNVRPETIQDNQITVNLRGFGDAGCVRLGETSEELDAEADGAPAEAQGAAVAHGIAQGAVLYVFQETSLGQLGEGPQGEARLNALFAGSDLPLKDTQGRCRLPTHFLGEYQVTGVAEETVTLSPTIPLEEHQIKQIQAAQGTTWVLCEILPIDRRDVFAEMSDEQMRALLPKEQTSLDDDAYAALIDGYVRDDEPANPADPDARVWIRVKFLKSHRVEVDVAADAGAPPAPELHFDSSGLAVSPLHRQGAPTEFAPGDTAIFDAETAQRLIEQQICEPLEDQRIYRRPLRDYYSIYHEMALQRDELEDEMELVRRQTAGIERAKEQADQQIAYRQDEKRKLQEDLSRFQHEVTELGELLAQLRKREQQMRSRMSQLYRENIRRAEQLSHDGGQL